MNKLDLLDRINEIINYEIDNETGCCFEDIQSELPEDEDDLKESKITHTDLLWLCRTIEKAKRDLAKLRVESTEWEAMVLNSLDDITSDKRWKHFEVGRTYLTRWDCNTMLERVRQAA